MNFEDFGYKTNKPCDVCGKCGENQLEPRFNYVVCKEHFKLSPVEVSKAKRLRELKEQDV